MIHYQLQCAEGHRFDGWFQDSAGFERLAGAGHVECPNCGGSGVTRALMSPALARDRGSENPAKQPAPPARERTMPAEMLAVLQRVRSEVEKNCDYVGNEFSAEARRMHAGESERRSIYGEATSAEAAALREDGVDVVQIPWVPRADG